MPRFGQQPLGDITRFELQSYLQELADQGYSYSIIHKARTYLNSVLDEALEQDFLAKNPARKLDKPPSQKRQAERVLVEDKLPELFEKLNARDRLITEIFLFCGLRPGELFVLRWSDWERRELRIDEAIWQGQIGETKTPTSSGFVSLPSGIEAQLQIWKQVSQKPVSMHRVEMKKSSWWETMGAGAHAGSDSNQEVTNERPLLYRTRCSQENHHLRDQDPRGPARPPGQRLGHPARPHSLGRGHRASLDRGARGDHVQRLGLRRTAAAGSTARGRPAADAEGHHLCQKEERPPRCRQNLRPAALQSAAALLHGAAADSRAAAGAALPATCCCAKGCA